MNVNNIANIGYNAANLFVRSQENLSSTRFIQDTATNWFPKAVFSRSKEDFAEMSFLEFLESAIFYFAFPILGEKVYRNGLFKAIQPKELKEAVNNELPNKISEIAKNNNISDIVKNKAITTKAGILLACAAIPVAEYTLSFAKNLFTLKMFHKSNFNNIASLGKNEKEDLNQQKKVEKSAKKHLLKGAVVSLAGLGLGLSLAKWGSDNKKLVDLSKTVLEPGEAIAKKLNIKNEKINNSIKGISLDFANNNSKLALSKGQLGLTAILGLFGYSNAAADRGKLDVLEVWTRVPLVVLYTIFGSELFEKGFINLLDKKNKCKDIIQKDNFGKITIPNLEEIEKMAKNKSIQNNIDYKTCYNKLLSQKTLITAVPYLFSLLFMGFTLSAITRLWTAYRYKHSEKNKNYDTALTFKNLPEIFKEFKN
ncbi:MAG: hypothetical protein IJ877_00895 [Candidatus Gastranaerophilales bacterium]|nr:hypothetical protein [Candidatus Gastranaerophilales bacterium]